MTCELIGVVVTNAETMLSKAQHNFFHPQKSLCWYGHAVGRRGKSRVCGTKKAAVLKGCVSHWIFTWTLLIKTRTVAKQNHITIGLPAGCSRAITKAAIISTWIQVKTQVLTKSFCNLEVSQGHFFLFPRNPPPLATTRPTELPPLHAVILPKELDKTALSGPSMFQHWEEFSAHQNAKQMLGSGVAQHSSECRNRVCASPPQPHHLDRKKKGKKLTLWNNDTITACGD